LDFGYDERMCGRFTLRTPLTVLAKQFEFDLEAALGDVRPRYNIAPTQTVLGVRQIEQGAQRELAKFFWGLVPSWAKDQKGAYACINARSDTVATKPPFRSAFKKRRCLVLADGYYEWRKEGKLKQPYFFEVDGGKPFAFAGLWEWWRDPGDEKAPTLESCCLLTGEPNELQAKLHDRMPIILDPTRYDAWLDPTKEDREKLLKMLAPFPAQRMTVRPVSTFVNASSGEFAVKTGLRLS
jgi:putative SOS response-associated peptidase YedK